MKKKKNLVVWITRFLFYMYICTKIKQQISAGLFWPQAMGDPHAWSSKMFVALGFCQEYQFMLSYWDPCSKKFHGSFSLSMRGLQLSKTVRKSLITPIIQVLQWNNWSKPLPWWLGLIGQYFADDKGHNFQVICMT